MVQYGSVRREHAVHLRERPANVAGHPGTRPSQHEFFDRQEYSILRTLSRPVSRGVPQLLQPGGIRKSRHKFRRFYVRRNQQSGQHPAPDPVRHQILLVMSFVMALCRYLALLLSTWLPLSAQDNARALLGEGLAHLEHARYEPAVEALERAVQLERSLMLAQYDLGVCYFAQGRFADAHSAFDKALLLNPHHRFTAYYLARLDLMDGSLDAAIARFANLGDSPPVADESYYLGSAYFRKGEFQPAIRSLRKAIALKPDDSRVHFLLARVYQKSGSTVEAK